MTKRRFHFITLAALAGITLAGCAVYPEDSSFGGYDRGYEGYAGYPYGGSTGYYDVYDRGPVHVSEYYYWHRHDNYEPHRHDRRGDRWDHRRNGQLYYGRRGEAPGHRGGDDGYWRDRRQADGSYRRDWRQGDGDFRRHQREQTGVGLEERSRLGRQERLNEALNDRGEDAIRRRDQRLGLAPDDSSYRRDRTTPSEFEIRQQQRSTSAERDAQRRAAEKRQKILAERRAASQGGDAGRLQRQQEREGMDQADRRRQRQLEREGIDPLLKPGTGAQTNR